ncbi:hypothetical protein IQ06DRAFT_117356 [Phaeosphaeriaceae sp. SRC1lsM3a]|nr:hypothetical protein IQ06DRAFT_117356 [Stagonospora sp. SRC1lsM3a]
MLAFVWRSRCMRFSWGYPASFSPSWSSSSTQRLFSESATNAEVVLTLARRSRYISISELDPAHSGVPRRTLPTQKLCLEHSKKAEAPLLAVYRPRKVRIANLYATGHGVSCGYMPAKNDVSKLHGKLNPRWQVHGIQETFPRNMNVGGAYATSSMHHATSWRFFRCRKQRLRSDGDMKATTGAA